MQLLEKFKRLAKSVADRFGFQIRRTGAHDEWKELSLAVLSQLQDSLQEFALPDLYPRPGRLDLISRLAGTTATRALYLVGHLNRCQKLTGDVCEFGVARGQTSAIMANEMREGNKLLWLFDSFQGLPAPSEKDVLIDDIFSLGSMQKYTGKMAWPIETVVGRMNEIGIPPSRYVIQPGYFEDTVAHPDRLPSNVCFAFVDFDFYLPIKTTLRFLNGCLADAAVILVDDYGFFSSGAKTAVDEFLQENPDRYRLIVPPPFAGKFCILECKRPACLP